MIVATASTMSMLCVRIGEFSKIGRASTGRPLTPRPMAAIETASMIRRTATIRTPTGQRPTRRADSGAVVSESGTRSSVTMQTVGGGGQHGTDHITMVCEADDPEASSSRMTGGSCDVHVLTRRAI